MHLPAPSKVLVAGGAKADASVGAATLHYSNDCKESQPPTGQYSLAALLATVQDDDDDTHESCSDHDLDDDEYEEEEYDEEDDEEEEEEDEEEDDDDNGSDSDDESDAENEDDLLLRHDYDTSQFDKGAAQNQPPSPASPLKERTIDDLYTHAHSHTKPLPNIVWLGICFFGIMISFVGYGLLLEYSTSDGRQLHEMSFLFITSLLYTITAAAGRYVRDETPSTIPPARFAILGLTSMGSTWCSVRSLRFVIFPIQVLAKSCKPVPVMIMGALMGKRYTWKKYLHVFVIVAGVALFMGGGDTSHKDKNDDEKISSTSTQWFGIFLLFVSLCFDGGTGAYEDKLMAIHSVGPFDLMYNIQLGKTILAGIGLIVFNQIHLFFQMCQQMGLVLVALGLTGALGQVFIFVTIAKFGALTCSIIGLARKITTLLASIFVYGHKLTLVQVLGLVLSIGSMLMEFSGKKKGDHNHHHPHNIVQPAKDLHRHKNIQQDILENEKRVDLEMSMIHHPNKLTVMTAGVSLS